ncbi:MAG: hypothetical protein ACTHMY_26330 [Solirubrobacteraceae bacterium]
MIIWATTVLAVLAIFAVWSNRQLLNPDNWSKTSTQLLAHPEIRVATGNYLVGQLYSNVDVAGELRSKLPPQLQGVAGPLAGALRNVAATAAQRALANPTVQNVWQVANRQADQTLVDIVNGGSAEAKVSGGEVKLDLKSILANMSDQLGLPDVSSKLPPSAGELVILRSNQLKVVQDIGSALKGLALVLTIIVPLLYALAVFLARGRRRRTLMTVGIAIVAAGLLVFVARKIVQTGVTNSLVKVEANKPAVSSIVSIATSMLAEIAGAFVFVGIPLIAAAWFAGPARLAVRMRRAIAPFLREHPEATFGIVAALLLLLFLWNPIPATSRPAGIIVFTVLAMFGTAVLRQQTAREFPGPP